MNAAEFEVFLRELGRLTTRQLKKVQAVIKSVSLSGEVTALIEGSVRIFVCGALETFPWRRSPPSEQGKSVRRGGKVGAHFIRSFL